MSGEETIKLNTRRILVEAGGVVILHADGPAGGYPKVVAVDNVADGLHWFLGSCAPVRRGETLVVESPVPNDARYSTHAKVMAATDQTFALRIQPEWSRVQQREFVRISAHGLQVRVERGESGYPPVQSNPDEEGSELEGEDGQPLNVCIYDLLDVSAGGIRFQAEGDWEEGDEMICHFELPGSVCFVLAARVARLPRPPGYRSNKPMVAVEFQGIDETTRSQLLRWVYREQVRRHKIGEYGDEQDAVPG